MISRNGSFGCQCFTDAGPPMPLAPPKQVSLYRLTRVHGLQIITAGLRSPQILPFRILPQFSCRFPIAISIAGRFRKEASPASRSRKRSFGTENSRTPYQIRDKIHGRPIVPGRFGQRPDNLQYTSGCLRHLSYTSPIRRFLAMAGFARNGR